MGNKNSSILKQTRQTLVILCRLRLAGAGNLLSRNGKNYSLATLAKFYLGSLEWGSLGSV